MQNEKIEDSRSWRGGVGQPRLEVRPRARDRARAGRDRARAVRGRVQPVRPRALRLERVSERPRALGLLARRTAGRQRSDGRPEARPVARPAARRRRERPLRRRLHRARLAQRRAHGPLEGPERSQGRIPPDSRAGGASTRTRSSLSSTSNCPTRAARRRTTTPRVPGWRLRAPSRHRRVIHAGRPVQRPHRQGHPGRRRGAVPADVATRRYQEEGVKLSKDAPSHPSSTVASVLQAASLIFLRSI